MFKFLVALILMSLYIIHLNLNLKDNNQTIIAVWSVFAFIYLVNLIVTCIIMKRLQMKGTSKELKQRMLKRHIIYFMLFTIF
jgi:hypothetical protein